MPSRPPTSRKRPSPPTDAPYRSEVGHVPSQALPIDPFPFPPPPPKSELFELFTTTDFKILRATATSFALTGFHPHEYVNISLPEYVHPADRHLLEIERNRLCNVHFIPGPLQSDRETQAAVTQVGGRELLSPAEGMREPYPNQNLRILRSDHAFDWYNIRLHLGGGLGASLWKPETLGKVYIVVSLLLLRPPAEFAMNDPSRRPLPMIPPTPVTAAGSGSLPSFSSFAAAAAADPPSSAPPPPPPGYMQNAPPPLPSRQPPGAGGSQPYYPPPFSRTRHSNHPALPNLSISNHSTYPNSTYPNHPDHSNPSNHQNLSTHPNHSNHTDHLPDPPLPIGYTAPEPPLHLQTRRSSSPLHHTPQPSHHHYPPHAHRSIPSGASGPLGQPGKSGSPDRHGPIRRIAAPNAVSEWRARLPSIDGSLTSQGRNKNQGQAQPGLQAPPGDYGRRAWEL